MHRAAVGRRLVAGVAVATMGASVLLVLPAGANHHYDCSRFGSQPLAQQALDEQPSEFTNLDPDGDGIACEPPTGGERGAAGHLQATGTRHP